MSNLITKEDINSMLSEIGLAENQIEILKDFFNMYAGLKDKSIINKLLIENLSG